MSTENKSNDTIDAILAATNHYQVLGLTNPDDASDATTLRKAYLKRSVQVHPDKTADPRATGAFQKVALAYQVLSDESTRREYDARGMNSDTHPEDASSSQSERTFSTSHEPSMRDAMFMFATVVGMMGGSKMSAAGDFAQTLFWAEKMVAERGDGSTDGSTLHNKANAAMAIGSSLRVVSATASMLGFRESAAKLEQTANLAQMAGVGAMAADAAKDVPVVKQVLEQGEKAFRSLEKNGDALKEAGKHVQQLRGSINAVQSFLQASKGK